MARPMVTRYGLPVANPLPTSPESSNCPYSHNHVFASSVAGLEYIYQLQNGGALPD